MIDKNKIVSVEGSPAVIIDMNDSTVTVLQKVEFNGMLSVNMKQVSIEELTPYQCPYTDEHRCYCVDGKCEYPLPSNSASYLQYACMQCMSDTLERELGEEDDSRTEATESR